MSLVVALKADQTPAFPARAAHKPLHNLPAVGAAIYIVPKGDQCGRHLSMVRDLGERHFEKIEAAVQISYRVSLTHRSKNTRPSTISLHETSTAIVLNGIRFPGVGVRIRLSGGRK